MSEITPFEIEIAEDVISDLKDRLSRTRWPDKETVDDWTQGVPLAYQKKLMDYWLNEYDFQRLADRLNQYDNFHTGIDNLSVKIRVCNSGSRKGKEVVQLYIRDEYASIDPDFEKLIAFKKIELKENECKEVLFTIDKSDLEFVNSKNEWIVEDGLFTLSSGDRNKQLVSYKINYQN